VSRKSRICVMAGKAFVDGNLVAEAEMMASIIDRGGAGGQGGGNGTATKSASSVKPTMK
jgi:hypothetical protein